jgi:hypothetical protein
LLIEKVNLKNKKVLKKWKSEIDFQGVKPSKVMEFHEATSEALKYSIDEIEKENLILKEKVKELENDSTSKTPICRAHCCYTTIKQSRGCTRSKF